MSKFDERLQEIINRKAEKLEEQFYGDFNKFLYKWKLSDSVKFHGLLYYQPKNGKNEEWKKIIFEKMVEIETDKFLQEIGRLNDYFGDNCSC